MGCSFDSNPAYYAAKLERRENELIEENERLKQELSKALSKIERLKKKANKKY